MKRRTALKAIRAKCIDCSCYQPTEVKECPVTTCALWPFRMGRGYEDPSKPRDSVACEGDAAHVSDSEKALVET
jgi:hypothetical protein